MPQPLRLRRLLVALAYSSGILPLSLAFEPVRPRPECYVKFLMPTMTSPAVVTENAGLKSDARRPEFPC